MAEGFICRGGGGARIATGSYTGTWNLGETSGDTIVINCGFTPKFMMVSCELQPPALINASGGMGVALGSYDNRNYTFNCSVSGGTISIPFADNIIQQVGFADRTYSWVAFG